MSSSANALRAEVERLRAELDELWRVNQSLAADHYFARVEKAEAEVERLREQRDSALRVVNNLATPIDYRLRESLREAFAAPPADE